MENLVVGLGVVGILVSIATIVAVFAVIALPLVLWRGASRLADIREELQHVSGALVECRRAIERQAKG